MKILELYAGSRSFGRNAELFGHEVFSVDWEAYPGINLCCDIEFITPQMIPFIPDVIWDSRDCTTYSVSAMWHHRDGIKPKTEYACKCDRTNTHVNENIIKYYLRLNPKLIFFIENPRGMLRKMPFMKGFDRTTVTYCQYGDTRMKPTDIWSNNIQCLIHQELGTHVPCVVTVESATKRVQEAVKQAPMDLKIATKEAKYLTN